MAVTYEEPDRERDSTEHDGAADEAERTKPLNRMRWATVRKPGRRGTQKRRSIFQRNVARMSGVAFGNNRDSNYRNSAGTEASDIKAEEIANDTAAGGQTHRTIYFNQPLPDEARDEEGHPLQQFKRNKIRTAKYTPISFIPKNLWFQLHNIANVYFIFIVILGVSAETRGSAANGLGKSNTDSATRF